jgi:hypothetical protein
MNGPSGVLTYLDYVYAGGRDVNAPGVAGQGAPLTTSANFTDKFQIFKIARNSFDTDTVAVLNVATPGTVYYFGASDISTAGADAAALKVAYVGKSRIDGGFIFRALAEGTADVSGWAFVQTVDITAGQTQLTPYISYLDGTSTIVTTAGAIVGGAAAGSVTGFAELVRALEDHVQGFAGAGPNDTAAFNGNSVNALTSYEPMRRGVGETTQYRTMGMQAFTKFVEAETFQVAATVTTEQIQDLNRQYGIDVLSMMENALVNDISQSINKHILFRAFSLGWQNHYNIYTTQGTNFNVQLVAGNGSTTSADEALGLGNEGTAPSTYTQLAIPIDATIPIYGGSTSAFENQGTIQRRIQSKVLAAANMVAQRGRRGPANFAVTNLQVATALQDSAQFTFYPLANTINQNNGALYPIGTLAGLTIYVDPNMDYNDTRVCVGRKGADEEPGLKFMPYLMAESIQTIAEGTMAPKIAVKSRYALVEAGFHPETQYLTFVASTASTTTSGSWNNATAFINIA